MLYMNKILTGVLATLVIQGALITMSNRFYITIDEDETSLEYNHHILELRAKAPMPISKPTTKLHN